MLTYSIADSLVRQLLEIGKNEDFTCISTVMSPSEIEYHSQATRQLPVFWKNIAARLEEAELLALIKAMTMAENILPGWSSGSVSPVIWLYNCYHPANPMAKEHLTDWILARTQNPWVPFSNHGARSLAEYQKITDRIRQEKKAVQVAEAKRQADAVARRAAKATLDMFNAVRRGDMKAIKALIVKGADLHAKDETGKCILERATEYGNPCVIAILQENLGNNLKDKHETLT